MQKNATVPLYDCPTKTIRNIPAAELSSDCMMAAVENAGLVYIEASQVKQGKIVHETLPPDLCRRIRVIRRVLKGIDHDSQAKWEESFRRDLLPEREVLVWERIVGIVKRFGGITRKTRYAVYIVVLKSSMATCPEHVPLLLPSGLISFLGRDRVERIAQAYFA